MSDLFAKIFNVRNQNNPRLVKEFSLDEFEKIYSFFRHNYKQRLNNPTAENNNLINMDLKCRDFITVNHTMMMLFSGGFTFLF